jgi:hypothetical protein
MWGNKILQKYRNEPGSEAAQHVAFVKGFIALLQGLAAYVKANHATSLSWKAGGGDALAAHNAASGSSSAPTSSGPPPPGPPPPGPPPGFWKDEKTPASAPPAAKTGACIIYHIFWAHPQSSVSQATCLLPLARAKASHLDSKRSHCFLVSGGIISHSSSF